MRIILNTTPATTPVPFDYQAKMVGCIHKWIGERNLLHDTISLYSFSWLKDGKAEAKAKALSFPKGATFFISFYDDSVIKTIIQAILNEPAMFCGMTVSDVTLADYPDFDHRDYFYCGSPIFIKRTMADGSIKQYNYLDAEAGLLLTETLKSKMRRAGLDEDKTLGIHFDTSFDKKKLKLVRYHGINNKASMCPVVITGKAETKRFAWDVGIGNCTGIGMGSIY